MRTIRIVADQRDVVIGSSVDGEKQDVLPSGKERLGQAPGRVAKNGGLKSS
jgi:hypothetical protein